MEGLTLANISEVGHRLFKIEVSLPKTPLKATNSYFIRGDERDFLIDTAFNHPVCQEAMAAALTELAVDMERVDLFITHLHSDHAGLSQWIAKKGTRIFMSRPDGVIVAQGRESDFWELFKEFYHFTGLYAGGHVTSVEQHPGYAYAPPVADNIIHVGDGHRFRVGDYELECLLTPGHTRGHLCLHDAKRRLLFSGDHILGKITPNITQMTFDHDALGEYLESLGRIERLDIGTVHPGHRHAIDDCRARIDELKRHHRDRLEEVTAIVGDSRVNTVEVARRMRWSLSYDNWDDYPPAQKLFSAGEALAHLHHLERGGRLVRESDADGIVYFRKGPA